MRKQVGPPPAAPEDSATKGYVDENTSPIKIRAQQDTEPDTSAWDIGDLWLDTSDPMATVFRVWDGTAFAPEPSPPAATGGVVTQDGADWIHTFEASDTLVINNAALQIEYLLVAGGGGGGSGFGGGGGGGGVLSNYGGVKITPGAGSFPIVIGTGGAGVTNTHSNNGTNSTALGVTAIGGGSGGGSTAFGIDVGGTGGSGGGAAGEGGGMPGPGTAGQGFSGSGIAGGGSGGGGAGEEPLALAGGNGKTNAISGFVTTYGGGGGGGKNSDAYGGTGGSGGGGAAGGFNAAGTAGTDGLGGGGGGTYTYNVGLSGKGGSGIVIIRYTIPESVDTSAENFDGGAPDSIAIVDTVFDGGVI